jgi:hypothetical protein
VAFVVQFVLSSYSLAQATTSPSAEFYINANASAIGAVHSIEAHIEQQKINQGQANQQTSPQTYFECKWLFDESLKRERLNSRNRTVPPDPERRPTGFTDVLIENHTRYKMLTNWDPARPQQLTPVNPGICKGEVATLKGGMMPGGFEPRAALLWQLASSSATTLRDVVRKTHKVKLRNKEVVRGSECVVLEVDTLDNSHGESEKWRYDIFIDPSANYMIRMIRAESSPITVHGLKDPITVTVKVEVVEFQEPKPGIFIPKRVDVERSDSKVHTVTLVSNLKVNEGVQLKDFDFTFPPWCRVNDLDSGKAEVIGEDGQTVAASFSNRAEQEDWIAKQKPLLRRPMRTIIISIFVAAIMIVVTLVYIRRRRRAS